MSTGSTTTRARPINTSASGGARTGSFAVPAPLVAVAGWLVPGLGYVLIGQRARGIVIGATILTMFMFGLLLAGVRVIDVPGYDDLGERVLVDRDGRKIERPAQLRGQTGEWALTARPLSEIGNKPWFVPQLVAGPICLFAAHYSLEVSHPANGERGNVSAVPRTHARLSEFGTLYTAIAGMLNLLAIIDAAYRAGAVHHAADDRGAA